MVHRDLKLSNLLLTSNGKLIISDFGKAIAMEGGFTLAYQHGQLTLFTTINYNIPVTAPQTSVQWLRLHYVHIQVWTLAGIVLTLLQSC